MRGAPWEPVALATKLGYVLSGPTMIMSHNDNGNTVNLTATHVLKVEASVVNRDERREDIKYSYPSRKTMSCFQIILHCASQGWFHS